MTHTHWDLTDDLLREMLERRAARARPEGLLAVIVEQVERIPRAERRRPGIPWVGVPALAAVAAVLVLAVVLGSLVIDRGTTGASVPPAPPTSVPEATGGPPSTPEARLLGTVPADLLRLGFDVAPMGLSDAFGSIWVADIRANDVRRFDPASFAGQGRVPVGGGPAWFAVADEALWVTAQDATGVARIDPTAMRVVATVGDARPCGAPVVAMDSIWLSSCDDDVFLRIDPASSTVGETVPAAGHDYLVANGDDLYTTGPAGLARLDPQTGAITEIGGCCGKPLGSDGTTVWLSDGSGVTRVDPADGRVLATFPYSSAVGIAFGPGRAWLTVDFRGVVEIDLATNAVLRTIPVPGSPTVPLEASGALWVTDIVNSYLWRVEP